MTSSINRIFNIESAIAVSSGISVTISLCVLMFGSNKNLAQLLLFISCSLIFINMIVATWGAHAYNGKLKAYDLRHHIKPNQDEME